MLFFSFETVSCFISQDSLENRQCSNTSIAATSLYIYVAINLDVDPQQDSAEERSKGNGGGTRFNRFAEEFEVVAADTGRIHNNLRNSFVEFTQQSRS